MMRRLSFRRWVCRAATAGLALVLADTSPAHAVIVQGRFNAFVVDWTGSFPDPLALPPLSTAAPTGGFTYDTNRVSFSPGVGSYVFSDPGAASLFLTVNGYTYSTTSGNGNEIRLGVGDTPGNAAFSIATDALFADPSNPLPWLPRLEFGNQSRGPDPFATALLPTSSFSTAPWDDADVNLTQQPPGQQRIRFRVTGDVSIRTVPEPRASWLPFLVPLAAVAVRGRRARGR
jgi:hypothetical protein